tara:strand:+ start:389 stop:601 length:213 start_codon:yes stop_codon:yes gene_type:complete
MIYTEKDIGKIVTTEGDNCSYYEERIVMAYCIICSARFIGTIRQAGGFLGGHEVFHAWEFTVQVNNEMEA